MQQAIHALLQLGPLPEEDAGEPELYDRYGELLDSITRPVTDEEACALVTLFGPDDSSYGLAWAVLHLIETAPNWPIAECLQGRDNEWIRRLVRRVEYKARLEQEQKRVDGSDP
jgi:hypothetical protein